ncbi:MULTISPECIES: hypothetical protein [Cytobacillus]|uniref:hypothetical protein n=1 Tax=Cytobacillus TaxID=2675230 RepID=UPI002041C5EB|nr:hypothetical protein [Cytobacillus firmus]
MPKFLFNYIPESIKMEIEENGIHNAELILLKVLEADSLLAGIDETSNKFDL